MLFSLKLSKCLFVKKYKGWNIHYYKKFFNGCTRFCVKNILKNTFEAHSLKQWFSVVHDKKTIIINAYVNDWWGIAEILLRYNRKLRVRKNILESDNL